MDKKELDLNCNRSELNNLMKEPTKLVSIFSAAICTLQSKNPNS